jgi:hypothetical protein
MDQKSPKEFNKTLALVIVALGVVITLRLWGTAVRTDNWFGFLYSFLHVALVAGASYIAIRRKDNI